MSETSIHSDSTLLVVDDTPRTLATVKEALGASVGLVIEAPSLATAEGRLHEWAPDLVIVSLALRSADGRTGAVTLRDALPNTPIIGLIPDPADGDAEARIAEAVTHGIHRLLPKPLNPSALAALLEAPLPHSALDSMEERRLRERIQVEGRLRQLYSAMRDGFAYCDPQGYITALNPAFQRMVGFREDELLGRHFNEITPKKWHAMEARLLREQLRVRGYTDVYEKEYLCGDGSTLPVELQAHASRDADGEIREMWAVVRDISERKRVEAELRRSEALYRDFVEETDNLVTQVDREGRFTYVNQRSREFFGLEPDACIGLSAFDFVHPDDRRRTRESFARWLVERTRRIRIENRTINRQGEVHDMLWNAASHFDDQGEISIINSIASDITQRKHMEQALRESEVRFRSLFENMQSGFALQELILDERGEPEDFRYLEVNHAFEEQTGLTREEVIGRRVTEAIPGIERDSADWIELFGRVAISGEPIVVERYSEQLERWYSVVAYRPEPGRFATVFLDITQRKQAEEQLQHTAEQLREFNQTLERLVAEEVEKNRDKDRILFEQSRHAQMGEMLSMIAHQWRQPLNAVSAAAINLTLASSLGELKREEVEHTSQTIQQLTQKMSEIINDFMEFFRPDREKSLFQLEAVFAAVEKLMAPQLQARGITLEGRLEEGLTLFGFERELEQVLINLIANARDAYNEGEGGKSGWCCIELYARHGERETRISVEDRAGGIDHAVIGRIFDPYFSTKPVGRGTGIGLYMSKIIIERNFGGSLGVENTAKGARFEVTIPD